LASVVLEGIDAQVVRQALALLAHSATFCQLQGKIMESCMNLVGSAHASYYSSGGSMRWPDLQGSSTTVEA